MYEKYVAEIEVKGWIKLLLIPLLVALLTLMLPVLLHIAVGSLTGDLSIGGIGSITGMLITLVVMPVLMKKVSKVKIGNLGIRTEKIYKYVLMGTLGGFLCLALVALSIWGLGGVTIEQKSLAFTFALVGGLVYFMLQGVWEELIYRAYLMPLFSKKYGNITAIMLVGLIFTLGHSLNPAMQALPIINLFIASLVFSLIYYRSGNLFGVGLAHGIWNFSQGYIFGSEVSGNTISASLFKTLPVPGKEIISGGNFGFEGSIVTTVVGIVLLGILALMSKNLFQRNYQSGR